MGTKEPTVGRCNAKARDGGFCPNRPMPNGRCYHHGGKSPPPGPGHPTWKTGEHSKLAKHIPPNLREAFLESLQDPKRLELRDELSVLHARMVDRLEKLKTGESVDHWTALSESYADCRSALQASETAKKEMADADVVEDFAARDAARERFAEESRRFISSFQAMGKTISAATEHAAAWDEFKVSVFDKVTLAKAERDREKDERNFLRVEQAMALMVQMVNAVKLHVKDEKIVAAIGTEMLRLVNVPDGVSHPR